VIRDGNAMSVSAKITQHLQRSAEGGLGVHDPVLSAQTADKLSNCFGLPNAAVGPAWPIFFRRYRRFKPAKNLPQNKRLSGLTGRKNLAGEFTQPSCPEERPPAGITQ
jgi:hypothetical protein